MHNRHASTLTRHEAEIIKVKAEIQVLKAGMSSLSRENIDIRKDVLLVVADLQKALASATEKLGEVAIALAKSDETLRALAKR